MKPSVVVQLSCVTSLLFFHAMKPAFSFGLGAFRFFLAILVILSHLWGDMIHGPGAYSVWCFYLLSGFLVTLILREKYGFTPQGLCRYAFNRVLRIYPTYVVCAVVGAVVLTVFRDANPASLNPQFRFPSNAWEFLRNVFLIPIPTSGYFVPVAGALATEVGGYVLMPLAAKSRNAAWLGLLLTAFVHPYLGFSTQAFGSRYALFLPALLAFFVGSLCMHYYESLKRISMPIVSVLVWCAHGCLWLKYPSYPWNAGLYVSMLCSAWVVVSLFPIQSGKTDKFLGDLSYPMFLIHTAVGMCFFPAFHHQRTLPFCLLSFGVILVVSAILVMGLERPLMRRFKRGALMK